MSYVTVKTTAVSSASTSTGLGSIGKILAFGLLAYAGIQFIRRPAPVPTPETKVAAAFAQADDRTAAAKEAKLFASICFALADQIDQDGKRPTPLLKTVNQLDLLRVYAREFRTGGKSFGIKYPALPGAIKEFLDARIGTKSMPLDAEYRAKCVLAFRDLGTMAAAFR